MMQIVTLPGELFLLHLCRCSPLAVEHYSGSGWRLTAKTKIVREISGLAISNLGC